MIRTECPFLCLFGDAIKCPYLNKNKRTCYDIIIAPGNGDAWCSEKIEMALEMALNMEKKVSQNTIAPKALP